MARNPNRARLTIHVDRYEFHASDHPRGSSGQYQLFGTYKGEDKLDRAIEVWTWSRKWDVYYGFSKVNATAVITFDVRDDELQARKGGACRVISGRTGKVVMLSIKDDPT